MRTARAPRKTEKVRGMNASLSMPTDLSSEGAGSATDDDQASPAPNGAVHARVGVIDGPALSERDPGRLHISRRQLALAVVIAAVAVVAGIYTVDAATVGDQSFPAVVSTSKVYDLNFANTGTVVAINVKPGQQVTAGEVLATQNLGTLDAQLHADQQVVAADQAAVQQASAPQLTNAQNEQNGLQVQQEQTALANAQAALTATTQTGAANVTAAQGAVTSAEAVAQGDYTLYTQACPNGPVPPDPTLTGTALLSAQDLFTHCQQLQSTSEGDQAAVAKAQTQVPVTQAQAMQADNSAQATVNAAQAALNLAQYQGTLQRSPANAESQAQAKAALNQATAQMDQIQEQEQQATIVSPAAGVVAQVNGSTGENLGPAGVPAYKAPASIQASQPSGFSLFPSQPTPSGSSSTSGNEPLVEIVGGTQQVTAQVPESSIGKFRVGQGTSVNFSVLGITQEGVVTGVVLSPTGNSAAVTYEVIIKLDRTVPGLLPGMTATVRS
jgi:multidrug efflux pump subunit AcrA (membrane-fusion protein)